MEGGKAVRVLCVLVLAGAVEVDRTVAITGIVSLGQHLVLAAEILAGRRVGIRVEEHTLMFFDLDTRELLRTRTNPLTPAEVLKLRGARPAGRARAPRARDDQARLQPSRLPPHLRRRHPGPPGPVLRPGHPAVRARRHLLVPERPHG